MTRTLDNSDDLPKDAHINSTNVIQVNEQSTIVKVGDGCKPKRNSCKKKSGNLKRRGKIAEKVCGKIFQKCNSDPKLYFRSVDVRPSALVQVENKSNCIMYALVTLGDGRVISESIEQEQQVTIDVPSIKNLIIECSGEENSFCRGLYAVYLRPVLIRRRKKRRKVY